MKSRSILTTDLPVLQAAIDADLFHPGKWKVEDFRGFSELYEDDDGVIVFCVYAPEPQSRLRISTMWVKPNSTNRNGRAIIFLVAEAAKRAWAAGFKELIFTTAHDKLANFCCRVLKFKAIGNDEFILDIQKESR
jgi:hypothetical protein